MSVLVLGAGGVLGQLVVEGLCLRGLDAVAATHRSGPAVVDVLVDNPGRVFAAHRPSATIYLAWATRDRSIAAQQAHVRAAAAWAHAARDADVTFVFVSTTLASDRVGSAYGQNKLAAEVAVIAAGGHVARVGLVVDDAHTALLASSVRRLSARLPWIAAALPWPVFPVASGSMVDALSAMVQTGDRGPRRVWVAEGTPVALAVVARWPHRMPEPSRVLTSIGRAAAARMYLPRVLKPALLDSWVGLVTGPHGRDPVFADPQPMLPEAGSWQRFTRPG